MNLSSSKFGIELRRIGNVRNLYRDVDIVLAKSGVGNESVGDTIKTDTVAHTLHKMFKPDNWLNVCTIRSLSELTGIVISKDRMEVYRSVHCMNWNEMTPEYRQTIMAMVLDDFRPVLEPTEVESYELTKPIES